MAESKLGTSAKDCGALTGMPCWDEGESGIAGGRARGVFALAGERDVAWIARARGEFFCVIDEGT